MEKKEQPSYSPEFQAEAVKLVLEQGLSIQAAAKRGKPLAVPGARSAAELEAEVAKLRRELAEAHMRVCKLNCVTALL